MFSYLGDKQEWPSDASVGVVPADFIAVTVEADTDFGGYVVDMLGPNAWSNGSFKFTWVIEWLQ